MKTKVLIPIFFSVFIGFLLGKLIFNNYDQNAINTFEEKEMIYFVLLDKFDSLETMKQSIKNLDSLLYIEEDNKFYVYGGISKHQNIAERIKEYYQSVYNNVSVQRKNVDSESFLNILNEYDKITYIATTDKDLISIEQIVLSNYKEMILGTWH